MEHPTSSIGNTSSNQRVHFPASYVSLPEMFMENLGTSPQNLHLQWVTVVISPLEAEKKTHPTCKLVSAHHRAEGQEDMIFNLVVSTHFPIGSMWRSGIFSLPFSWLMLIGKVNWCKLYPKLSIYGIFTYIWLNFTWVNSPYMEHLGMGN